MRVIGPMIFALAVAGLGLLSLMSGDFALAWQPVPEWVPGRAMLAYLSGVVLLLGGLGLLVRRTAALSALVLTADFLIWLLLLQLPRVKGVFDAGDWLGVGETTFLVCGAWAILASDRAPVMAALTSPNVLRGVSVLFGFGAVLVGISHFVYAKETAALVPAYLPERLAFAYFTGAAHIAAGIAIAFATVPRLAATLEGLMMSLFGLMVWAPKVIAAPTNRLVWTAMLVSLAYGAASLALVNTLPALSLKARAWKTA